MQVVFIVDSTQGRRVVFIKNDGFDFRNGLCIPKVATHVNVFVCDIGKKVGVFLVMQKVVAVHSWLVREETNNSFLGFTDSVAGKLHSPRFHQIGYGQPVVIESVMFNNEMAYPHHPDSFIVAPKHIIADDDRIHGCLNTVRRIA